MSNLRKLFFVAVSIMTVFGVVGFVPMGAKAATAGSLIKMAGNSAVYYFDGTKRYVFPQENVYKSWYKDFSGVQTISQSELQSYPIGGNVTMRPGTWMVKITTDPKVYAVTPGGVLHWVDSETRATTLWGANWNKMIVDVSDAFFVNYTTGTALTSNTHPDGTVIMRGGQYYYVMGGNERPFASEAALAANMINTAFAVTTTMDYPDGSSITGAETAITNVAGSSSNVGTSAAGLTVSGGTMTASTSLPLKAGSVKVGTWNFAAGPEGAVTLNSVTFKRSGVGNVTDIANAYIYDGVNRLTSGRTFGTSTNEATFTLNLSIPAGSTKALSLYVSIASTALAGNEHVFGIESATAVSSNAASVNGVFPINSNKHSIAGASAGQLTVTGLTNITNPRVGDKGFKVAEFRLGTDSVEDAWVNQVTLTQGGNISNSALSNFQLKQNGTLVASASAIASNDRLDLVFSPAFKIDKGNDRTFELYADITGRPDDTIKFYLDETADVMATGGTFGVGVYVVNSFSTGTQITLQGGQFTITFDGPSSGNISNASTDVVVWKGSFYSANQVEVRNVRVTIADANPDTSAIDLVNDANDDDDYTSGETVYVQDIKLWNLDNNTVIAGPVELAVTTTGDSAESQDLVMTEDFILNAGQTMNVGISVDIRNTPAAGITLKATLGAFTGTDIKNTGSNTYLDPATDIVPNSTIPGQNQTVTAAGLTISTAPSPTTHTMIKGSSDHTAGAFNFVAGSGSSVKVNSIQVTAQVDNNNTSWDYASSNTAVNNLVLSAKLMDGTTQVGTSKTFSSGVATFDNLNWLLTASQTKKLDVVITTNSAASIIDGSEDYLRVLIAASAVNAVDSEGNTVTGAFNLPQNGPAVTVTASGTLTVSLAPTPTNPSSSLVAAGSTDKVLAAFKFEAINESFSVKKFTLIPYVDSAASANSNDRIAQLKVRYPKQAGGTETRIVGLSSAANLVDISDMPMYVPQNGSASLEVLGDFANFTILDGTEVENITFGLDLNNDSANNQATGLASNTDYNSGTWGAADIAGNQHNVYRTVLTVAAGSGTPNNTARTRSASQKVASWNLSASSSSNAFIRGSLKATDGVGAAGWSQDATDPTGGSVAYSTTQKVSGAGSLLWTTPTDATAGYAAFDFGDTTSLQKNARVGFWVYSNQAVTAGHIVLWTNSTAAYTATNEVSIGAVSANTWTYVDTAVTVNSGSQYAGLYIKTSPATYSAKTIYLDDFRFYTDSINVDVAGDLLAAAPVGLVFSLKDSGGTTRAYGAYSGSATVGTVKLIAGNGADVTAVTAYSPIEISSSTLSLDLETNTNTLMKADTTANEALSVSVDTGTVGSAGDFSWYDNSDSAGGNDRAALTAVSPLSTTISFSNTY